MARVYAGTVSDRRARALLARGASGAGAVRPGRFQRVLPEAASASGGWRSAALDCPRRDHGALEPYPVIREFAAMLSELKPGKLWKSREFFGYTSETPAAFHFPSPGQTGSPLQFYIMQAQPEDVLRKTRGFTDDIQLAGILLRHHGLPE
jgi:hypothetical protein